MHAVDLAVVHAHQLRPEGPFLVGQNAVVQGKNALGGAAEFLQGGADAALVTLALLGRLTRGHGVEEYDIVFAAHFADIGDKVLQVLDITIGVFNAAEQGVEARHVKGVSAGDDGDFWPVCLGWTAHRYPPRLSLGIRLSV